MQRTFDVRPKPVLTDSEMLAINRDLVQCGLEKNDISNPTSKRILEIYREIIMSYDMSTWDENAMPQFQNQEHKEMYRTSFKMGLLSNTLRYMFGRLGSPQAFEVSDILFPDPHRTRCFLATLLNFAAYCIETNPAVTAANIRLENMATKKEEIEKARDEIKSQYLAEVADNAARKAKLQNFETVMAETGKKKQQLTLEIQQQNQNLNELDTEAKELEDRKVSRMRMKDDQLVLQRQLESQLVNSPNRFRGELDQMKCNVAEITDQVSEREATVSERQQLVKVLRDVHTHALEFREQTKAGVTLAKNLKKASEELALSSTEIRHVQSVDKQVEEESLKSRQQLADVKEQYSSVVHSGNHRIKSMNEQLHNFQKEAESLEDRLDGTEQRESELRDEKTELNDEKEKIVGFDQQVVKAFVVQHNQHVEGLVEEVKETCKELAETVNKEE